MAVITISRQFGAGGKTLGQMIAEELDYRFVDDTIIQEISRRAKVSTDWVKSTEKTAGGTLSKWLTGLLSRDYIDRIVGEGKGYIDEEIYVDLLREVITKFAEEDNVVLMGRGGQYILADFEGAYHILLSADRKDRIRFMEESYNISHARAVNIVAEGERRRASLYRKFGKDDYNQSHLYHLTLNMSKISLDHALKLVCLLVRR
ncbi:MAG: cytidylate kinase-like family protein [Desulfatiglans sp.]|jgi:cytidylate kinase|nr:cytidylate kinase-like family protein [Thermodesulfobacteriota bacterium]MEE4352709.1 cytidylate kinase-like family protein [Desulfatiglans sp.]